jgi:two-component system aerobic respiration control sensor histidine kinase ArcB
MTASKQQLNLQEKVSRLQERVEYLEAILEQLPGHVYWQDRNNVFMGCNKLQAVSIGIQHSQEIVGKTLGDYFPAQPDEVAALAKVNNEVMATGQAQSIEEQYTFADNIKRIFLSHKIPLRNKQGHIIGLLGVSLDISQQKALEQELAMAKYAAEATLQGIVAVMPGNVYWKDLHNRYLGCNDEFARLIKLTHRQAILGKTDYDFLDASMADIIAHNDQKIIAQGKETTLEELGEDYKGNPAFYLTRKAPLFDANGKTIGLVGVSIDITDRKKMELALIEAKEKAESANKAKSDFLTNMSHDIRTPLSGILGFSQLLELREQDPAKKELLEIIFKSSRRLVNLLDEIIELANIETYGMALQHTQFSICALLEELAELMMSEVHVKNLEFVLDIAVDVPAVIVGDKLRIHRILLNLLGNALKFTHEGGVYISVHMNISQTALTFIIRDTGIGIPDEQFTTIFDKFSRLTRSNQSPYKGTGLGLYIAKKFIDDLGGTISVTSEIGQGTTFTCTVPCSKI